MARYRELPRIQRLLAIHLDDKRKDYVEDMANHFNNFNEGSELYENHFRAIHPALGKERAYLGTNINNPVSVSQAYNVLRDLRTGRDKGGPNLTKLTNTEYNNHLSGVDDVREAVANRHNISPLRIAVGEYAP
jgi:hypothetical protein